MKSLSEEIYQSIYDDILMMKLKPGQRLHIADLCKTYCAGLSPVREALAKLTATDFVIAIPQKGFRVVEVSLDDLNDIFTTRINIEVMALSLAIKNGTDEWEAEILASHHRLQQLEKRQKPTTWQDYQEWEERHRAFIRALLSACNLRHLIQIHERLLRQTERYRRLWVLAALEDKESLQYAEKQKDILDAALARDVPKATMLLRQHYEKAQEIVGKYLVKKGLLS